MKFSFLCSLVLSAAIFVFIPNVKAQEKPLTQTEFVQLLQQLPKKPSMKEELVESIRTRGIGFVLTDGLRSLAATKSGSDVTLRRTLEEAERRRANPTVYVKPSETEGTDVLEKARQENLKAADEMPDFIVKQLIKRSYARGGTSNWRTDDHLILAVSYSSEKGEDYKLLAVNGVQPNEKTPGAGGFQGLGGTTSTGEYVTVLKDIFSAESKTTFKLIDTDILRDRKTIVYEFEVKKENSRQNIVSRSTLTAETIAGFRGRIWVDRENFRVLRVETIATEIPPGFPVTAASRLIDYDWVQIYDQKYLLPSYADIQLTARYYGEIQQSRNEIRFKSYQKFGSEVKVIEDDIVEDEPPPEKKDPPKKKPGEPIKPL